MAFQEGEFIHFASNSRDRDNVAILHLTGFEAFLEPRVLVWLWWSCEGRMTSDSPLQEPETARAGLGSWKQSRVITVFGQ